MHHYLCQVCISMVLELIFAIDILKLVLMISISWPFSFANNSLLAFAQKWQLYFRWSEV